MSTQTIALTTDIHPEIPMPHWAADRYLDDNGREVCDERSVQHGNFDIELAQMHTFTDAGVRDCDENVAIWWDSVWSDFTGVDREQFTVLVPDIPGLVAALQHAHDLMTSAPRTLRRAPEATAELAGRDA